MNKKTLIIHQGAIGDLMLSLPALYTIRTAYLEHHFEFMGYPRILCLLKDRFYADAIASIDSAWISRLYAEPAGDNPEAAGYFGQFDKIWIFAGKKHSAFSEAVAHASGIPPVHVPTIPAGSAGHIIDLQLCTLSSFGLEPALSAPKLFLTREDRARAHAFLNTSGLSEPLPRLAAIHPGSGSPKKNWPLSDFARLAALLSSTCSMKPLVLTGPAEEGCKTAVQQAFAGTQAVVVYPEDLLPVSYTHLRAHET